MHIKLQDFANINGKGRVRAAFGRNYELLAAIKNKYNPNNLFRNQNLTQSLKIFRGLNQIMLVIKSTSL